MTDINFKNHYEELKIYNDNIKNLHNIITKYYNELKIYNDNIKKNHFSTTKRNFLRKKKFKNKNRKIVRPVFFKKVEGEGGSKVKLLSGGLLFYRFHNKKLQLLMAKYECFEDFGGKSDKVDKNIYDTIAREVCEETNEIFSKNEILGLIKNCKEFCSRHGKYLVCVKKIHKDVNLQEFGKVEIHLNIKREVKWINFTDFDKLKINGRLNIKSLKSYLKKLNGE